MSVRLLFFLFRKFNPRFSAKKGVFHEKLLQNYYRKNRRTFVKFDEIMNTAIIKNKKLTFCMLKNSHHILCRS